MKRFSVFHPFLFAIFPILFLFAHNIDEVPAIDISLPILVVITGTLILFFLLRLVTKNYYKSGIITSCFLVLFFSHGHICQIISPLVKGAKVPLILEALIFISVVFLVMKLRTDFKVVTTFLNIVAITLVAISVVNVGIYAVKTVDLAYEGNSKEESSLNLNSSNNLPDIYYIIIDSYGRASTLKEIYNYDNSEFIDHLTDKGFYVASKSRTNYAQSMLSLTSSSNMEYLGSAELQDLSVANNKASQFLKARGYRCIFVSSGFFSKGISEFGEVYLPERGAFGLGMTNFVVGLIKTTSLEPFRSLVGADARNDILYVFDTLADMPNIKGPKFVFAHMLGIHAPLVFDRYGNPAVKTALKAFSVPEYYEEGYVEQLIFTNNKLKALVDEILLKSDIEPIIILQADHGPESTQQLFVPYNELTRIQLDERMNIFNAYYFPHKDPHLLYESITPVNTFRIVFNLYFDADYDILEDKSYFSGYENSYDFFLIPPENT